MLKIKWISYWYRLNTGTCGIIYLELGTSDWLEQRIVMVQNALAYQEAGTVKPKPANTGCESYVRDITKRVTLRFPVASICKTLT